MYNEVSTDRVRLASPKIPVNDYQLQAVLLLPYLQSCPPLPFLHTPQWLYLHTLSYGRYDWQGDSALKAGIFRIENSYQRRNHQQFFCKSKGLRPFLPVCLSTRPHLERPLS